MERWVEMEVLRSRRVAVGGRVRGWGVPWWVIVMVTSFSERGGSEGAGSKGAASGGGEAMVRVVLGEGWYGVMLL